MSKTALYRFFDAHENLLYVGISNNFERRKAQHKSRAEWFHLVASERVETVSSREYALDLEQAAIRHEKPMFNKPAGKPQKLRHIGAWQGPPRYEAMLLAKLDQRQTKGIELMTMFLHLLPKGHDFEALVAEIGIDRFIEVANMAEDIAAERERQFRELEAAA